MNPLLIELILEVVFKLIELWIDKQNVTSLTVGENNVLSRLLEAVDAIGPHMTQRQHRRYDVKLRRLKELCGMV